MSIAAASILVVVELLAWRGDAQAQIARTDFAVSSAPSPVGAGARATGVGSAFIAIADDATAASWNPGGLIQLERPEISLVGSLRHQVDDVGTLDFEIAGQEITREVGTASSSDPSLNYASAALPFSFRGRNVVVAANYQQMLSFGRRFDVVTTGSAGPPTNIRFEQEGAVYSFSPAAAVELTPELSLGATFNYWFDGLARSKAWSYTRVQSEEGDPRTARESVTASNFRGVNGTFGALWRVHDPISLGAFVELPFKARFTLDGAVQRRDGSTANRREELAMELPLSCGLGVSVRPNDRLVLSLDATYVRWRDFRVVDRDGNEFLVSGDPVGEDNPFANPEDPVGGYSLDDVITVRAGGELLWRLDGLLLATRAGAFYDPEPSRGSPEDFFGGSLGLGIVFADVAVDFAYQLRWGPSVDGVSVVRNLLGSPEGDIEVIQHDFYLSAIVYF